MTSKKMKGVKFDVRKLKMPWIPEALEGEKVEEVVVRRGSRDMREGSGRLIGMSLEEVEASFDGRKKKKTKGILENLFAGKKMVKSVLLNDLIDRVDGLKEIPCNEDQSKNKKRKGRSKSYVKQKGVTFCRNRSESLNIRKEEKKEVILENVIKKEEEEKEEDKSSESSAASSMTATTIKTALNIQEMQKNK